MHLATSGLPWAVSLMFTWLVGPSSWPAGATSNLEYLASSKEEPQSDITP